MQTQQIPKQNILSMIEDAFTQHQFQVYLQPKFNHATQHIIGAEALARWFHPIYGLQSPGVFIPVLEENNLITRLDLYIFEEVCIFLAHCMQEQIKIVPVSFNISRYDILKDDYLQKLEDIRNQYHIPVKYLHAEITETSAVCGNEKVQEMVEQLHKLGYLIEMDDFGSGYSSLNFLKDVEFDVIKLDMAFLRGNIGGRGGTIISSIIRMANWLNTPVIAEGVETIEQADYMKSIGCDYVQGFLYSPPIPQENYLELLNRTASDAVSPALQMLKDFKINNFWNPDSQETFIFNNYVGGAAIFSYGNGKLETVRVNEKYIKEIGMNMSQKEMIHLDIDTMLDESNRKILYAAVEQAIRTNEETECETWRTVYSDCCGTDSLCIRSNIRMIAKSQNEYLLYVLIRNITKEKIRMLELTETNEKFAAASEQANMYCWEYMISTHEMRPCFRCMRDLGLPALLKNYPESAFEMGVFPPDYWDLYRDWIHQLEEGVESIEGIIPLTVGRIPFWVRYTLEKDESGRPFKAYGSAVLVVDKKEK